MSFQASTETGGLWDALYGTPQFLSTTRAGNGGGIPTDFSPTLYATPDIDPAYAPYNKDAGLCSDSGRGAPVCGSDVAKNIEEAERARKMKAAAPWILGGAAVLFIMWRVV